MQLNHLLVIVSRGKHRKVQLCDCRFYHQRGDDLGHWVIGALGKLWDVGKRWSWRAAGLPACCYHGYLCEGSSDCPKTRWVSLGDWVQAQMAWSRSLSHLLVCRARIQGEDANSRWGWVVNGTSPAPGKASPWPSSSSSCMEEFSSQIATWKGYGREIQGQDEVCTATKPQGTSCQQG